MLTNTFVHKLVDYKEFHLRQEFSKHWVFKLKHILVNILSLQSVQGFLLDISLAVFLGIKVGIFPGVSQRDSFTISTRVFTGHPPGKHSGISTRDLQKIVLMGVTFQVPLEIPSVVPPRKLQKLQQKSFRKYL